MPTWRLNEPETYLLTACGIHTTPLAVRAAASDSRGIFGDFRPKGGRGLRTDIGYYTCPLGADIAAAVRILFPAHRHSVVAAHQRVAAERHDNMDLGP